MILDPFGQANVDLVKSIFGGASATVTALSTLRVESISRAVEVPEIIAPVKVGHVEAARAV